MARYRVAQNGRYEDGGVYANHFDLGSKFPGGNQPIALNRLSVTALLPTRNGDHAPQPEGAGQVLVELVQGAGDPPIDVRIRDPRNGSTPRDYGINKMSVPQHVGLIGSDGLPAVVAPPATERCFAWSER